ncbi:hypothetical protein SRB5_36450 [Streptomyces sp. RB5]|uniref:HTH cro/C1-type domain-containing protein n=1 Tax=Streptomyces smaragdinus TaxID=2585196 RepID=A0A7K0CJ47_9ACTN|nr:helix-turn-helix transcriptional regulator [Streptomyces smaragdinus]MQY13497.1 hypothetical protein [Streptomyces smaragdinus]
MSSDRAKKRSAKGDDRPAIWVGYGQLLKLLRERAGVTQPQLAEAIGYSYEQVAAVEQGRRPAKAAFTAAAERVMDANGVLDALQPAVDQAKLPLFFQNFASIELEAVSRFDFDPVVLPGLLQTEEYARALFVTACPHMDEETVEQRLEARLSRQAQLLGRKPMVDLSFIIGEGVLYCPVGGRDSMRAQLRHLLEIAHLPNVAIQIMPMSHGAHVGLDGPMVLLETTENRRFAYFESHQASMVISDSKQVGVLGLRYGKLRSEALNVEESARLIEHVMGETWLPSRPEMISARSSGSRAATAAPPEATASKLPSSG